MGKLKDLVNKGVRLLVVDASGSSESAPEADSSAEVQPIPRPRERPGAPAAAETFEPKPTREVARSTVPANVQDWNDVYQEAGITLAAHGYGVDKVQEMLSGRRLAPLAREVKATAVLAALEAAQVPIRDVVQDAVQRDHALDAFEAAKQKELAETRARNAARIESLQAELKLLSQKISAELEALQKQSDEATAAFASLQQRKQQEEQRLFEVVSYFIDVSENPVSAPGRVAGKAGPEKPGPKQET